MPWDTKKKTSLCLMPFQKGIYRFPLCQIRCGRRSKWRVNCDVVSMEYVITNHFNDYVQVNIEEGKGNVIAQKGVFYTSRTWKEAREKIDAFLRKNGINFIALPDDYHNLKKLTVIPYAKADLFIANAEIS